MTTRTPTRKQFPPLYSLNSDGSLQEWRISVRGKTIIREYGRVGGAVQISEDTIHSGKNVGRANATTAEEQALREAESAWEKKQKSGYHPNAGAARAGKVSTAYVAGGVEPMLAHKWSEHSKKIQYPAWMQPKLDGIRCIAMIKNGVCTLWSRTRKQINSVPHIVERLEEAFPNGTVILDGELYNHAMRDKFEEIVSLVRKDKPDPRCGMVQYHVYDTIRPGERFEQRWDWLTAHAHLLREPGIGFHEIDLVPTLHVDTPEAVILFFTEWRAAGYEGAMIRNNAEYEHKRSYHVQKIKEFDDSEFEIIGVEPGRGRMSECAVFVCRSDSGEFRCKLEGSLDALKEYLDKPKRVIGKMLTVRYQGLTNGGLPRFPVGVAVRDYE